MSYDTRSEALVGAGKVVCDASFSVGTEATNVIPVVVTLYDFNGEVLSDSVMLEVFMSADSTGTNAYTIDATTSSLAITSGGKGTYYGDVVGTTSIGWVKTEDGQISLDVTDTNAESIWLNIKSQNGQIFDQILTFA